MVLVTSSAALGGIMGVVFSAWAFGRLQGGFAEADDGLVADPRRLAHIGRLADSRAGPADVVSCPQAERAECRIAIGDPASLGELHAEISAYRRAERVFAALDGEDFALRPLLNREPRERRGLAFAIEEAHAMPADERHASARIQPCSTVSPQAAGVVQPSTASGFTRV